MAAYDECEDLIGWRPLGREGENRTTVYGRLVTFARCVREHSYFGLPDPDFSGASGTSPPAWIARIPTIGLTSACAMDSRGES